MSNIQHELSLIPVTAVEFWRAQDGRLLLFVGEGVYLKIYDVLEPRLLATCRIFDSQAIRGIAVGVQSSAHENALSVTVWGGKAFSLLSYSTLQAVIKGDTHELLSSQHRTIDWILAGVISPFSPVESCLLVAAHNAVICVQQNVSSIQTTVVPSSQAILYSADIMWLSQQSFLVAAGSVFGEIEVWQWHDGRRISLYTLAGHEGSIFGVRFSPSVLGTDGIPTFLLATCSDDRTIRVWDVRTYQQKPVETGEDKQERVMRDTGFGSATRTTEPDQAVSQPLAVVMGHASRIWGVKFLVRGPSDHHEQAIDVFSFGEDATCQQWSLIASEIGQPTAKSSKSSSTLATSPYDLQYRKTYHFHTGKHIWGYALYTEGGGRGTIATAGADASVSCYEVHASTTQSNSEHIVKTDDNEPRLMVQNLHSTWTFREILAQFPVSPNNKTRQVDAENPETNQEDIENGGQLESAKPGQRKSKKPAKVLEDSLNRYAFVTQDSLLATTSFGRIIRGANITEVEWQEIELSDENRQDFRSYALVTGVPRLGIAFLAGAGGALYMYRNGESVNKITQMAGKIAALLYLDSSNTTEVQLLVTVLGGSASYLLAIDVSPHSHQPVLASQMLVHEPGFVVTSAGNVAGHVVLGSRAGLLAFYSPKDGSDRYEPVSIQHGPSNDAITSIIKMPATSTSDTQNIVCTSRDGSYFILAVCDGTVEAPQLRIMLVHHASPPFVTIENAWFHDTELYLCGFRSKDFIVWHESSQTEILNIECGGAHRSYAYFPLPDARGAGIFVYTKASHINLCVQNAPSHQVVKKGSHGREIKACSVFHEKALFATGSEDTTIRISRYESGTSRLDNNLRCEAVIHKHTSGIQALRWDDCFEGEVAYYLFSASGNEEFNIWRIRDIPAFGLGVVLENSLPPNLQSPDRDLRITSFDFRRLPNRALMLDQRQNYCITIGLSDSTLKTFYYHAAKGFVLIAETKYTAACITQVEYIKHQGDTALLTASTDGHIVIWSMSSPTIPASFYTSSTWPDLPSDSYQQTLTPVLRHQIHQSSILSMSVLMLANDILLATGGDDNALVFTHIKKPCVPEASKLCSTVRVRDAHAAAITGLSWINDPTGGPQEGIWQRLWTVGIDQRLKRWTFEIQQERAGPSSHNVSSHPVQMWIRESDIPNEEEIAPVADPAGESMNDVKCSVADPAGLVAFRRDWTGHKVLVFGAGLQVFGTADGYPAESRQFEKV